MTAKPSSILSWSPEYKENPEFSVRGKHKLRSGRKKRSGHQNPRASEI